ncbi:MAG TPA: hypothetical protein DD412_00365 [Holosporales bacterium]|nr:hypothetical protein [Holosporales bacterium]
MHFVRLFLAIVLIFPSHASSSSEEAIFEKAFITHIKFMPPAIDFYGTKVRLYLPNRNSLEFELGNKSLVLELANPIDSAQESLEYYAGPPYTFLEPKEESIVTKENGLLRGAARSFYIPGEGGPFERDAIGRLWPSGFSVDKMTSTIELTLFYDADVRGGVYKIESRFVPND